MHALEIRRQILHLLYGPLLILLYDQGLLTSPLMLAIILIGAGTSLLVKHKKLSPIARLLGFFERPHHMEHFPGRGILFFTIGSFLCLLLFEKNIAYAGIMVLSVGDAVANVAGRHLGRIKTKLNPEKYMEGTLLGILVSIPIAYYFVGNWLAASIASFVAMFLEMPNIKLFNFEIDDNLIIPLAASTTLNLFV